MDIFFEVLNLLISAFCVFADGFQVLKVFLKLFITQYKNSLFICFFEITKMLTDALFRISFSVIGRCSPVPISHWMQGNSHCARIDLSLAAFGITLQNHRRLPISISAVKIAALRSLKLDIGMIFKMSN